MPNILICLSTTLKDEPVIQEAFHAGFESAGIGKFNGRMEIVENINSIQKLADACQYAEDRGYGIVTTNFGIGQYIGHSAEWGRMIELYSREIQLIAPAGINNYQNKIMTRDVFTFPIIMGAGLTANLTGYDTEFFNIDPFGSSSLISRVNQEGTVYNISQINRQDVSGHLAFKLSGITNMNKIGITGLGVPIQISGITGTDISPLPPDGIYYVNFKGDNQSFAILHTTTSGTSYSWQNVTGGTVTFGLNPARTMIQVATSGLWFAGWGVELSGITGFSNNPNGAYGIVAFYNNDNYYNKFAITHNVGTGEFVTNEGAAVQAHTSSYSTPFFAGVYAATKTTLQGLTNWEVRKRLRDTASEGGILHPINGYGYPNYAAAVNIIEDVEQIEDPYQKLANIGTITASKNFSQTAINVQFKGVLNAIRYIVYENDIEHAIYLPGKKASDTLLYTFPINRKKRSEGGKTVWKYKAFRGYKETAFSNSVTVNCSYYDRLLVKKT